MSETLPTIVAEAYNIQDDAKITVITDGHVNDTYAVDNNGERTVLQRTPSRTGEASSEDILAVSSHLVKHELIAPLTVLTIDGASSVRDDDRSLWRSSMFIESDGIIPAAITTAQCESTGQLLGSWHEAMASFSGRLQHDSSPIHNADQQAARLETYLYSGDFSPAEYSLGKHLLSMYKQAPELDAAELQVIHGDPKLNNFLYVDGQPIALIDYDLLMHAPRMLDCGDMARSVTAQLIGEDDPAPYVAALADGYAAATGMRRDYAEQQITIARTRLALTLGMRCMNDVVHMSYFKDVDRVAKAELQIAVAEQAAA